MARASLRGSNAVAAVAVVILLYVAVLRSHLGAGQGGSVGDSGASGAGADNVLAVLQLQRELNGVSGLARDLTRSQPVVPPVPCAQLQLRGGANCTASSMSASPICAGASARP